MFTPVERKPMGVVPHALDLAATGAAD